MSRYSMATRPSTEDSAKPWASGKARTQRVWAFRLLSRFCSTRPCSRLHTQRSRLSLMMQLPWLGPVEGVSVAARLTIGTCQASSASCEPSFELGEAAG